MSGNPKQTAAGGQQIRYPTTYQPMQQPLPPRENFIQNQNYVQQPPNQASTQGVGLRGIAQPGPPNQAPTPPNQDLKVQAVPQQPPMNLYTQQNTVRPSQQFFNRPSPPTQNARMTNNPQRIYQNSPHQFMQVPQLASNVYVPLGYSYTPQQRQNYVQPQVTLLQGQHYPPAYQAYTQPQLSQSPQTVAYQYFPIARPGPPPQPSTTPTNPNQAPIASSISMPQAVISPPTTSRQHKRRPNAISIIDPATGCDKLDEIYEQDSSHPPSGESSARQTPQPASINQSKKAPPPYSEQIMLEGELVTIEFDGAPPRITEGSGTTHELNTFMPITQQAPMSRIVYNKFDNIAQTSTLKAHAKEFILPSVKETPIVSANCDSVEVTLNKLQKGRESPIKGRKVKEHHKEATKEINVPKEAHVTEKPQTVVKEETETPASEVKEPTALPIQHSFKVAEKENEKRKKDNKSDHKQVSDVSKNDANQPIEHEAIAAPPKAKHNSNQKKDNHKSNNQRSAPPSVPQSQPAKSNSKTTKKNELNTKGANKEGSEMDVFQISDTVNANVPPPNHTTPPSNNSDVINANATVVPTNVPTAVVVNVQNAAANDVAPKAEIVEPPAKPTQEVKTNQKKWEVTNVFMGRLPAPSPYVPTMTENNNQDETDRAVTSNDRAIKSVSENAVTIPNQAADKKPQLPYKEGQWSPFNLEGDKRYDRDFLMALRDLPPARVKPANLPENLEYSEVNRQRSSDNRDGGRSSMMGKDYGSSQFMMPFGGKNSMKGSSLTKHPSLSGKMGNKGGKSLNGANKISISLRDDIKLHETENAWKPGRLAKSENKSEEERKTEELYKKVRGVLNKLTPQKFDTLLSQIKELKVDTYERLQGVINLVFEKAIDEPNFAVAYAKMCMEVGMMQVHKINDDGKEEVVNFRKLLITRCQEEFEKQSKDESNTEHKIKEIQECKDPEKKKELEDELEETRRRIRMRSVGNVRFIGELFKISMLTVNIMTICIGVLLQHKDEESLECLCRLLTTIGRKLEESKDISEYFNTMQKIVNGKEVSSRIRFMLQDVIDLRRNKWVPRRQDAGPKTIDQIARDVATEQLNSQILTSVPSTPRRDERDMGRGKPRNNQDEWSNHQKPAFLNVNKDKLKHAITDNETLGQSAMFQKWNKGSTFKPTSIQSQSVVTNTSNRFSCLENSSVLENDKKNSGGNGGGRYKDSAYSSKGSSLERSSYGRHNYDSRGGSRSGSQHRVHEGAGPSGLSMPGHNLPMSRSSGPQPPPTKAPAAVPTTPAVPKMTEEQLKRYCKNCCEEYINDNCTFADSETDIKTAVPTSYMATMVSDSILDVLETSKTKRIKMGTLLGKIVASGTVPLQELCKALEDIFSQVEDLIIDIPTIFACLAEILVPIIVEDALPLTSLQKCLKQLVGNGMAEKMLLAIFKLTVCEKGPNYLKELWQGSKLKLTDFMAESSAENFIQNNQLEFLTGGQPAQGNSELNYEQIEKKLIEFFNANTQFDDICMWITANVGKRVEESTFVRTLATAIYKYSIVRTKLNVEHLTRHYKLFNKYVDNNPTYELQCLYALQSLVNQLEHPQGLLLSILNKLSEDSIFAQESFLSWESSDDPAEQVGKGVALNQLRAFFTQLKENDYDDDEEYVSTGSDEA